MGTGPPVNTKRPPAGEVFLQGQQLHHVAHPGDGLALLGGGGGHQSPGGAEKDVPQLPALHAAEKVAAQHRAEQPQPEPPAWTSWRWRS